MNLPNKLTLIRISLVPVFIACFYVPLQAWNYIAIAVFALAYITDVMDGYYARKYNLITDFGKLMDPIADKLLAVSALIMLVSKGMIDPLAVTIMVSRELLIGGFRMVWAGKGKVVAADRFGKTKTLSQVVAIILVLLQQDVLRLLGFPLDKYVVWIAAFLAVFSAARYIKNNKDCIDFK